MRHATRTHRWFSLFAILVALPARSASAQACDLIAGPGLTPLVSLGGRMDVALRDSLLLGRCRGTLIRSSLSLSPRPDTTVGLAWLAPVATTVWNSTIPASGNSGAMWNGRGWNALITAGARWDNAFATIVVAPEITVSQNRGFPVTSSRDSMRSQFASPWYNEPISADMPLRFGSQPFGLVTLGQTTIELHGDRVGGGLTTENQWWGPGIRNAIVMSNNAAGIPQIYLRTVRPLKSPIGEVEARLLLGELTPSRFFARNDPARRSISAGVVTLRLPFDSGLTVGGSRAVYGPVNGTLALPKHWADVLWRWNQKPRFSRVDRPLNQILSLFYQWVIPEEGFETYAEWARLTAPRSFGDILIEPQKGQGYTVGLQSLRSIAEGRALRIQAEATMLEQTPTEPGVPVPSFYTSHRALAGYTQRGQVIGASIGPGGSSQFIAMDLVTRPWSSGVEIGRIQWNHEAYYQQASGITYKHHDVSLFAGLRGSADVGGLSLTSELILTDRLNFLFLTSDLNAFDDFNDMGNVTFKLSVTPTTRATRKGQKH